VFLYKVNIKFKTQDIYGQGRAGVWSGASNRAGSFGDKISTRTGGSDIFNLGGNYFVSNTGNTIYATTTKKQHC
jgi:hypothetical protein